MALVDYNSDKITNGEEGEVIEALNTLLNNGTFEDIEIEENIGIIGDYEITLGKEKGEVIIDGIDKGTGNLRLRCKLSTKEYTKENIIIQVKASGNIVKLIKPDNTEATPVNGKIELNYPISENGTYLFKLEGEEGTTLTKEVVVDIIDRLDPLAFEITAKETLNGIKINASTEDAEADGVSVKSGIDRYEYYVKKEGEADYTKYDTNEIELEAGTHSIYVKVYDKAKNYIESNPINVKISVKVAKLPVSCKHTHSLIIDTKGNIWAWGANDYNQLGNGNTTTYTKPIQITSNLKFKEVSVGNYHSLAIDEYGNIWGWGENSSGQVGDGTKNRVTRPKQITEGIEFKQISAGHSHSLAIDNDGNIWAWGINGIGQFGKPSPSESTKPIQVTEGKRFKMIVAEEHVSLAIDEEGKLWSCGHYVWGQLGNGANRKFKSVNKC